MRAMILCAGLGTRLRPLTDRWPKPALPFLGAPLVRYGLATLKRAGIREVGINTHHLPELMEQTAASECEHLGLRLSISRETVLQGTGGGIRGLRRFLAGGPFVVLNGDILFAVELPAVIAAHQASGAAASMVLMPMPQGEPYGAVEADPDGEVRRIAGHGPGGEGLVRWHFTGVHVMSPEVFDFMSANGPEDINHAVYPRLIAAGRKIHGVVVQGYWSDLGTPERYLAASRDVLFGQVPAGPFADAGPLAGAVRAEGNYWVRGEVFGTGRVSGPALLEDGARIDPQAWIGAGVHVGRRATVGQGARLNRAVVLDDTEIAPGEVLVDAIAWPGGRLRPEPAPACAP